jgi:hypothetical protein
MKTIIPILILLFSDAVPAQTISYFQTGEEFAGPFPSWKSVKDFGAKGDGSTDDAAAINKALNAMRFGCDSSWNVLYFPAGNYLIKSSLHDVGRSGGSDYTGTTIVGEDPATTIITCGASMTSQNSMLILDGTYTSISRLTFDGKNIAGVGLMRDGGYGTDTRVTDLVCKDLTDAGVQFGGASDQGQDLSMIERCRFTNCANYGLRATNANVMGLYCMWCLFEDCGAGIENGAGSTHSIGNVFLRSKNYDIGGGWQNYLVYKNISVGSKTFFSQMTTRNCMNLALGNAVYNTTGNYCTAPVDVMVDNVFASTHPFQFAGRDNALLVGNTFTTAFPAIPQDDRYFIAQQKIVDVSSITVPSTIALPGAPQNKNRKIFEVAQNTSDDAAEIQKEIDAACKEAVGSNPVVHFSKGTYQFKRTVTIPSNFPIQLVGDASNCGSFITWSGTGTGPMFLLSGPSRVTFKCLNFASTTADAISIENADQVGGRVYAEQTNLLSNTKDIVIDGVENSDITWLGCYLGMQSGSIENAANQSLIDVAGGSKLAADSATDGQISFLMGYLWGEANTFNLTNGARLLAGGYRCEVSHTTANFVHLTQNSGDFSWVASDAGTDSSATPFVLLDGYKRTFASLAYYIAGIQLAHSAATYQIQGDGTNCKALVACGGWDCGLNTSLPMAKLFNDLSSPTAHASILNCVGVAGPSPSNVGWLNIPELSNKTNDALPDTQLVLDALKQLRALRIEPPTNRPAGTTDVKFIRGWIQGGTGRTGLKIRAASTSTISAHTPMIARSTQMLTMKLTGASNIRFHMPNAARSVTAYDVQGRAILRQNIVKADDIRQIETTVGSMARQRLLVVRVDVR